MQYFAVHRLTGDLYLVQNDSPFPSFGLKGGLKELALRMLAEHAMGMTYAEASAADLDLSKIDFDLFILPGLSQWIALDAKLVHKLEKS